MKKVVLALSATLMAFGLAAQDHPSQAAGKPWWVSGSVLFANNNSTLGGNDISKTTTLGFSPSVGYMLTNKIGVGLNLGLTNSKTTNEDPNPVDESVSVRNNFGLFGRYYAIHTETFGFWGQLDVAFGTGKDETTIAGVTGEDKVSSFAVGISPGIQYWFSPAWSITATAGFLGYRSESIGDGATEFQNNGLEATIDFNTANFAINFHF
jgi:hypothetical protein